MEQDEPDTDAEMKQAEVIGDIDLRLRQQELQTLMSVRAKLTPEQREALKQRRDEIRERFGERGGHGMHHRGRGGCPDRDAPTAGSEA
jgi:Spy/CpxP family protein refolding chaperone